METGWQFAKAGPYQDDNWCRNTRSLDLEGAILEARIIRLGPGECTEFETGARYFAALAFPAKTEVEARSKAVTAWVASYLHEQNRVDRMDAPFEDDRLNAFAARSPEWCRATLRTANRRLTDRAHAARAVRPWVRELLGQPHDPVAGVKKFTQRQIALYLQRDNIEAADNFQKRVWRPSRPVLHLAVAQDLTLASLGHENTEHGLDLAASSSIKELVKRAALVASLIVADPRFGIDGSNLIQLEWVN